MEGNSLVPHLCALPSEKWSGEQSRISWAYFPKEVNTNEIARLVILCCIFTRVSIPFLSGFGVKCFECC